MLLNIRLLYTFDNVVLKKYFIAKTKHIEKTKLSKYHGQLILRLQTGRCAGAGSDVSTTDHGANPVSENSITMQTLSISCNDFSLFFHYGFIS